jgi:hypothetical protein
MGAGPHRLSDDAIWSSIARVLRDVVVPAVDDPWARSTAVQLAALADLARTRRDDPAPSRAAEVAEVLSRLGVPCDAASYESTQAAASAYLGEAGEDDSGRAALRAVLVRHLDEDLAESMALMTAFRGKMPDASAA